MIQNKNLHLMEQRVSPEVMLTGFPRILAVQSSLDTCSHDTFIHSFRVEKNAAKCETELQLWNTNPFLLSSMRHPLPCEGK